MSIKDTLATKVIDGTRSDSVDLCKSCTHSTIARSGNSKEMRYCSDMNEIIPLRVAECSSFYNKNLPSLRNLYETAWILSTDRNKVIGFSPYNKWKKNNESEANKIDFD